MEKEGKQEVSVNSFEIGVLKDLEAVNHQFPSSLTVMVSLKAPEYRPESRAAIDLVLILDKSGSMGGEKIKLLKETAGFISERLTAQDRLAVIAFDNVVQTLQNLTPLDEKGKLISANTIQRISANGGTNISDALFAACELLWKRQSITETTSILLFTDGRVNSGLTTVPEMKKSLLNPNKEITKSSLSVSGHHTETQTETPMDTSSTPSKDFPGTCYAFGFGADHDATFMKDIAEMGNGLYYFVENKDKINESFADCFGGLISVAAQNIKIQIQLEQGAKFKEISCKYRHTLDSSSNTLEIDIKDIQAEEKKDLIFDVELEALPKPQDQMKIGKMLVSFANVLTGKEEVYLRDICVSRPDCSSSKVNVDVDLQRNRVKVAKKMEIAAEMGKKGDLVGARTLITQLKKEILESVSASDPFTLLLLKELDDTLDSLKDEKVFETTGHKLMSSSSAQHYMQRSNSHKSPYMTTPRLRSQDSFSASSMDSF